MAIDTLLGGNPWAGSTITYSFFNGGYYYGNETGVGPVSAAVRANVRYILHNLIEPLINVRFVEVPDTSNSFGTIRYLASNTGLAPAYAYLPTTSWIAGDVHLNRAKDNAYDIDGFQRGIGYYGFWTLIHETLHALGLKHPGK